MRLINGVKKCFLAATSDGGVDKAENDNSLHSVGDAIYAKAQRIASNLTLFTDKNPTPHSRPSKL